MDSSAVSRVLPHLATLLAASLLGYVAVQNLHLFQPEAGSLEPETEATATQQPRKRTPNQQTNLAQLSNWHLFGQAPKKPKASTTTRAQPIQAPKTRLQLSLRGIVAAKDDPEGEGWAIISAPGQPEKAYRVGDPLPGGANLYAVEAGQVILTRNKRHESLPLTKTTLSDKELGKKSPSPAAAVPAASPQPVSTPRRTPRSARAARPPTPSTPAPSPMNPMEPDPMSMGAMEPDPMSMGAMEADPAFQELMKNDPTLMGGPDIDPALMQELEADPGFPGPPPEMPLE